MQQEKRFTTFFVLIMDINPQIVSTAQEVNTEDITSQSYNLVLAISVTNSVICTVQVLLVPSLKQDQNHICHVDAKNSPQQGILRQTERLAEPTGKENLIMSLPAWYNALRNDDKLTA